MSLGKFYYDPKHTAEFGSEAKLAEASKNKGCGRADVRSEQVHVAQSRTQNLSLKNKCCNIDDVWETNLAHLNSLWIYRDKYNYLLNVIDLFSRYAWSVTMKNKIATSITAGLNLLFQNKNPITIQSVKRTEFVNGTVQEYLKRQGVNFTTHHPDIKGAIIEYFN
jgi:hypothetical protein